METFFAVVGSIAVILGLTVVALYLLSQMIERWATFKEDQDRIVGINSRKNLGSDIRHQAHWLHGEEYDTVPPYVVLTELGKQIQETSRVDIDKLRTELLAARDEYRSEIIQNKKTV